jgi:hypothetical protein
MCKSQGEAHFTVCMPNSRTQTRFSSTEQGQPATAIPNATRSGTMRLLLHSVRDASNGPGQALAFMHTTSAHHCDRTHTPVCASRYKHCLTSVTLIHSVCTDCACKCLCKTTSAGTHCCLSPGRSSCCGDCLGSVEALVALTRNQPPVVQRSCWYCYHTQTGRHRQADKGDTRELWAPARSKRSASGRGGTCVMACVTTRV